MLVNVVDAPDLSDFIVPAVVRRGDLLLAISTSGASPALAKRMRQALEEQFGPEYERYLDFIRTFREQVLAEVEDPAARRRILERVAEGDVAELFGVRCSAPRE